MRAYAAMIVLVLAMTGCHKNRDHDEPIDPPFVEYDLSGRWGGAWESSVIEGATGSLDAKLVDDKGQLSGVFYLDGSPYIDSGEVVGYLVDYELALEIHAGGATIIVSAVLNPEGDTIIGQYRVIAGPYEGDVGLWAISRP